MQIKNEGRETIDRFSPFVACPIKLLVGFFRQFVFYELFAFLNRFLAFLGVHQEYSGGEAEKHSENQVAVHKIPPHPLRN